LKGGGGGGRRRGKKESLCGGEGVPLLRKKKGALKRLEGGVPAGVWLEYYRRGRKDSSTPWGDVKLNRGAAGSPTKRRTGLFPGGGKKGGVNLGGGEKKEKEEGLALLPFSKRRWGIAEKTRGISGGNLVLPGGLAA